MADKLGRLILSEYRQNHGRCKKRKRMESLCTFFIFIFFNACKKDMTGEGQGG